MKQYIDKDKVVALSEWIGERCTWDNPNPYGMDAVPVPRILQMEPEDVRPVVRGDWKWSENDGCFYCSECGALSPETSMGGLDIHCPLFCYKCGADMRGTLE